MNHLPASAHFPPLPRTYVHIRDRLTALLQPLEAIDPSFAPPTIFYVLLLSIRKNKEKSKRCYFITLSAPGGCFFLFFSTTSGVPLGGQIPASLGTAPLASTLEELKLRHAEITGTLPPELGNMPRLRVLSLKGNQLSGTIPSTFAHGSTAAAIQQLDLQDNPGLIGPVPDFPTLYYTCCWCEWRHCGVYLQGTSVAGVVAV